MTKESCGKLLMFYGFLLFVFVTVGSLHDVSKVEAHESCCDQLALLVYDPCLESEDPEVRLSCLLSRNTNDFNLAQDRVVEQEQLRGQIHNKTCGQPSFYRVICTYDSLEHQAALEDVSILTKSRKRIIENYKEEILRDCS